MTRFRDLRPVPVGNPAHTWGGDLPRATQDRLEVLERAYNALLAAVQEKERPMNREQRPVEDDCVRPDGHEWQLLTRHPDPPDYEGVLANAGCLHCSSLSNIHIESDDEQPEHAGAGGGGGGG